MMHRAGNGGPRRRRSVTSQVDELVPKQQALTSSRQWKKWATAVLAVATVSLTVLILWTRIDVGQPSPLSSPPQNNAIAGTLGIVLHPEEHRYRSVKSITLDWTISSDVRAPDGVRKRVYTVNGFFPGPTIEARTGDELIINVSNELETEGISMHWHGLEVPNIMDGVVGFTQCPIGPRQNFTYRFKVTEQHGTFWWHAHSQSQRADGMFGGLIIHKPYEPDITPRDLTTEYDNDILLVIGDWFHRSANDVLEWYTSPGAFGNEPVPDSLLINGRGRFDCTMSVTARPVECEQLGEDAIGDLLPGKIPTRLRLINAGTVAGFSMSVPNTTIQIFSVDGGCPVKADPAMSIGVIYPGERVDVLLQGLETSERDTKLQISLDPENFKYTNPSLKPNQYFSLHKQDMPARASAEEAMIQPLPYLDLGKASAIKGLKALSQSIEPDHTILLYVKTQKLSRFNNQPRGFINHTSWAPQELPLVSMPRIEWDKNQLVPFVPINVSPGDGIQFRPVWVDIVINNLDDGSHPFHLHGHSFYVISRYRAERLGGWGSWNPFSGEPAPGDVDLLSPLLKDTISVPRRGHVILRVEVKHRGLWMLHCHMGVHLGSGMSAGIHVGLGSDEVHVVEINNQALASCAE